jgi:Tol biopolymer transport system component
VPTGGYDIDVYDIMSGSLTQATSLAGNDEYKPSLSKNGGSIVQI